MPVVAQCRASQGVPAVQAFFYESTADKGRLSFHPNVKIMKSYPQLLLTLSKAVFRKILELQA